MATGMARGAAARGKKIAFGDCGTISWDRWSPEIFKNNPNIAKPGDARLRNLEWINYRKGNRIYNSLNAGRSHWIWNMEFRPVPGELFFDDDEREAATREGRGFIVIEPNTPPKKPSSVNKQWARGKYEAVAKHYINAGREVVQFAFDGVLSHPHRMPGVRLIETPTFRHALAVLSRAALFIGPEGGLHHGAAAVDCPAVVIFGGFVPPEVTGYASHINLTGGAATACGYLRACPHCREALEAISVHEVIGSADRFLGTV